MEAAARSSLAFARNIISNVARRDPGLFDESRSAMLHRRNTGPDSELLNSSPLAVPVVGFLGFRLRLRVLSACFCIDIVCISQLLLLLKFFVGASPFLLYRQ